MGYYSDVSVVTTRKGAGLLRREAVELAGVDGPVEPDRVRELEGVDAVLFEWEGIKWYEDMFPDVRAWMEALDRLGEAEEPYQFVRVGGDDGDVEELGGHVPGVWLGVERHITCDVVASV